MRRTHLRILMTKNSRTSDHSKLPLFAELGGVAFCHAILGIRGKATKSQMPICDSKSFLVARRLRGIQ